MAALVAPLVTKEGRGRSRRREAGGRRAHRSWRMPERRVRRKSVCGVGPASASIRQRRGEREGWRVVWGERRPQSV